MILNRDCFFYKKSDFINRLPDISEESICYIADTQQIYVQGRYFECNVTRDIVEQLIQSKGYLTPSDLPVLTGGAAPTSGEFVSGVSVGGHTVNVQKGKFSEINAGTASKLETPREIALSGDATGSVEFDGSQDVVIETTVHNSTTADRLTTPRTISLDDQATGQVSFDGSGNVTIPVTVNQLDSKNANNNDLNDLVTLNGYVGNLFYGSSGNTSENKPDGVDSFGLLTFKSAAGNYSTQILGSNNRLYTRSNADSSLNNWRTIAYLTDNVASATKLQNTRTFTISDGTHSGTSSNFDGTGNVTLRLPTTINANINGDIVGDITGDVVGNVTGDLYGNADTASKLETPVNISLAGDVSGTVSFDGSKNVTINTTVGNASHTHTLANISDLQENWDAILKAAPTAQVTRWPSISEVTGKQNLILRLNGGTTEGTNQFTYNGAVAKTINITPSAIDAATSGHTHSISISSNATTNLTVSAGGTTATVADLYATYADQLRTARTISLTGDVTGSVSFNGASNVSIATTVANDSHSHSNYVQKSGDTMTGPLTITTSSDDILVFNDTASEKYFRIKAKANGTDWGGLVLDGRSSIPNLYLGVTTSDYKVWHSGNDGSDSGLDADLLDGYHGSYYLQNVTHFKFKTEYDANVDISNGGVLYNYSNAGSWVNAPSGMGYGIIVPIMAPSDYSIAAELAFDIHHGTSAATGNMWFRGRNTSGWGTNWKKVVTDSNIGSYALTPSNYTSYTVTKTGGGASGTWGINITGNAASASSVAWANVSDKPSWIGSSKPSYSWSDIANKPSTFTPSSHNHSYLSGWSDTRSIAETPNSYNSRFEVVGIKNSSTYGISSGTYVQVLGFRGWSDSSGGNAHELAFADNGRIYHRDGATTSWGSWDTVAYTSDLTWSSISGKPSTFTPAAHEHSVSDITSGTLSIARGGTGASTAAGALTNLGITATATELNYVAGVTTGIQKQLDTKSDTGHTHSVNQITNIHIVDDLPSSPTSGHLYFVY